MGIGFGRRQFMKYAGDIARKRGIPFKNGLPSKKWWSLLKKRHLTLRLRVPEGTAAIRHQCMDKEKVSIYFNALKQVMDEMGLYCKPHCVWNMDETGLQLQHTPDKVVTKSCSRYIQSRTSGNCETITIIATISASGTHIPPHIIVKGKTRRALNGFEVLSAPERSTWSVSDSGWTKQDRKIQNEHHKSNFNSNKDNGILINDCYKFDEENEALSTQTSKNFDSSIYRDVSSIYGDLKFKDCLKNSDISTESELDNIIEQLPNSLKKNESSFDDSDNLYESNSSASSLFKKLESRMVQLIKKDKNKLEFLSVQKIFL
ncbi:uncharacterized protein LOC136075183 isoform X2 [Hydra vulgaris]|uniref:Uncharacterized protein LOC136075183 isoform X2 n=1 Tax=Hydra vulgaris TaxID=6087 RepID=A0ABM4B4D0_HYDVU